MAGFNVVDSFLYGEIASYYSHGWFAPGFSNVRSAASVDGSGCLVSVGG